MAVTEKTQPENKMATMPVGKLLFTMSLPLMFSMIMEALYNVVDSPDSCASSTTLCYINYRGEVLVLTRYCLI
jgi:hypothetical protein